MDTKGWSLFTKLGLDIGAAQRFELMANLFDQRGRGSYVGVPGSIAAGRPATSVKGEGPGDPTRNEARNFTLTYRSEEHTSELQSLMRISYAVFCLKKKKERTGCAKTTDNCTITCTPYKKKQTYNTLSTQN